MPIERLDPARPVSAIAVRIAARGTDSHPAPKGANGAGATGDPVVERSTALDPGEPPVDIDRVTEIRRAIERGDYPILPAKVADAMIAAGLLLRSGK